MQQLHIEDQRRVGRDDASGATRAIAKLGGDNEPPVSTNTHTDDARVPPLDNLAAAQPEGKGTVAVARAINSGRRGSLSFARVRTAEIMHVAIAC